MRLFLGKFSTKHPNQIEGKYYASNEKGNPWYGGVEVGDYVFPSYGGMIIGLWQAEAYTTILVNDIPTQVLKFEEIKTYSGVKVSNVFAKYKYFEHDLNMVNKITKSLNNLGFIPIKTREGIPNPEDIDFVNNTINIYVALRESERFYNKGDIRVTINNSDEMAIDSIDLYNGDKFEKYSCLDELYRAKNEESGFYTIKELARYAVKDNAPKKKKFLHSLVDELNENGYMKVASPIKLYDLLLVGRKADKTHKALESQTIYEEYASLLDFNPNMILYGPPGTGKTYATEMIIDEYEKKHDSSSSFSEAFKEDRVKSITFHQSYSYEEFIEGIRPILNDNDNENVGYVRHDGIFKEHSLNAEKEFLKSEENAQYIDKINQGSSIWKMSLGERYDDYIYDECIERNEIAIGWLDDYDLSESDYDFIYENLDESDFGEAPKQTANTIFSFVHEMNIGDIVMIYDGRETIRMMGIVKSGYRHDLEREYYYHRRSVEWFDELNYPINILKYNDYKTMAMKTLYKLNRLSIRDVVEIVSSNTIDQNDDNSDFVKPYYFVIDEINRGNIAKIFGELITLVEQDKRGKMESILPYSKKPFTVPSNLYLIGTMNTADRSIAAIDTALRRRFTFVEIEPDSNILNINDSAVVNESVDLVQLLDALNDKISEQYDRDHRLGHAYLMGIDTLKNLYHAWYYKILPLLNDYFYNDDEAVSSIVGKEFFDSNGNTIYLSHTQNESDISPFEKAIIAIYEG